MSQTAGSERCQVDEHIIQHEKTNLSKFFRDKRKKIQSEYGEGDRKYISTDEIAKSLGLSVDMLQQKIYGKKPMTRNWLIAIAIAHGTNYDEVEKLLSMFGMPRLDATIPQEDSIIEFLFSHADTPMPLDELNKALALDGQDPLIRRHGTKKTTKKKASYTIARELVRTYFDEGDPYDSLCTEYDYRYTCTAIALLSDGKKTVVRLEADAEGRYAIYKKGDLLPRMCKTLEETGEYKVYFAELLSQARRERRRILNQIYDTKNYQSRSSANLKNDRIHVFFEEYNYSHPERNEYNLMEYVDGHLRLTVSRQSMFMREYLSHQTYDRLYGKKKPMAETIYDSLEEIDTLINSDDVSGFQRMILEMRKKAFQCLSKHVLQMLDEIKKGILFIRNYDAIYGDNPGELCEYYGLLEEFDCETDDDNNISVRKNDAAIQSADGSTITLTFDELKTAFILGYTDVEQICRVIHERGSVEAVF